MALDKSILAAAKEDYKAFEKEISPEVEDKMKNMLSGFMNHLQQTQFKEE